MEGKPQQPLTKEEEDLEDLIDELETLKREDSGAQFVAGEENGVLQYLFFCTSAMRDAYEKYPEVLLIVSTYKTNKCNMPLTVFVWTQMDMVA